MVRAPAWVLVAAFAGCHPSATVERTMPVANLQSYKTVGLRVRSTAFAAQGMAYYLESSVLASLQRTCGFSQVERLGSDPTDVILDLNITNSGRGGGGWITNSDLATLDTLLVLTDGQNGELLGTARIHGKSSGAIINNSNPEQEAVDVVAKTIADLLAKSGCSGPRIARVEPPPTPTGDGTGSAGTTGNTGTGSASEQGSGAGTGSGATEPAGNQEQHDKAEAFNADGRDKLQRADVQGALTAFQQAVQTYPDPRYQYNVCLAYEAGEQWNQAVAACKQARSMNPDDRLAAKIDHRLDLLAHRQ